MYLGAEGNTPNQQSIISIRKKMKGAVENKLEHKKGVPHFEVSVAGRGGRTLIS